MSDREKMKSNLLMESESKANLFNIRALIICTLIAVIAELLMEVGLFTLDATLTRISTISDFFLFMIPFIVYYLHDKVLKKEKPIIQNKHFKILVLVCAFTGITIISILLSFHAVLVLIIPVVLGAQYKKSKRMFIIVLIVTILTVPITIYGSFFFGIPDKNLLKALVEGEEAMSFAKRVELATPTRMVDVLTHYVIPRTLEITAIDLIVAGITKRDSQMLDEQIELSSRVQEEMEKRNDMQLHVIEDLASVIETRDLETGKHIIRTKEYVKMLSREMAKYDEYKDVLTDKLIDQIENTAPLHDVGKIAVSDTILLKPAKLTKEEFELMKVHTIKGGEMIQSIFRNLNDDAFFEVAFDIAKYHHERWDGSGYPEGLKHEEIPLSARIMALADVFDALTQKRVYKPAFPPEEALLEIKRCAGTQFDPKMTEIFLSLSDELIEYVNNNLEE